VSPAGVDDPLLHGFFIPRFVLVTTCCLCLHSPAVGSVVVELIELAPPPGLDPPTSGRRPSVIEAAALLLPADLDLPREAGAGRVIGTTEKTSVATLLRPPGLQAVHTAPLSLPLSCVTLPAATLAAVERCLAVGPPPPPPPPAAEPKKGGAAAAAAAVAAPLVPAPQAAAAPTFASVDAAVAALLAKSKAAVTASLGVYVLEVLPAMAAVLRPDSEAASTL
jgi:hypothetical protein